MLSFNSSLMKRVKSEFNNALDNASSKREVEELYTSFKEEYSNYVDVNDTFAYRFYKEFTEEFEDKEETLDLDEFKEFIRVLPNFYYFNIK